jgi:LDH2 family malate/lactate/ureidoglycolate dehydrogenase
MKITLEEADRLATGALVAGGFTPDEAKVIAEQTIGCEMRGATEGGLSRVLSIIETYHALGKNPQPMQVSRETPVSALIDGGDQLGYLVADRAINLACEKARVSGIGIVGANNTWYTGMYVHYMEKVARQGLVAMCCGSSAPRVAPFGSSEGRFGTNPIAFAFPSADEPIVLDFATSGVIVADAVLASRTDRQLPEGVAWDKDGNSTTDPVAALAGAFAV